MKNSIKLSALFLAIAVSMPVLAEKSSVKKTQDASESFVKDAYEKTAAPASKSTFIVTDGFYAAKTPLANNSLSNSEKYPQVFMKSADLNIQSPTPVSDLASRISKMSGYQVTVDQDVLKDPSATVQDLVFKGNLVGLLDTLAIRSNSSWRWDGNKIHFYKYETKMFQIYAISGTSTVSSELNTKSASSGGTSGSSSTGNSGQSTKIDSQFDVWKDVETSIKASLSSAGQMSISTSSGTITVRDTPASLSIIERQISEFNKIYARQVVLKVDVYAVEQKSGSNVGIDWNGVFNSAGGKFSGGISSNSVGTDNGAASPTISLGLNAGQWAGSSVMLQALSTVGKASLLTSGTLSMANGQSAPLNVSREQSYLQSYSTTLSGGVGTQSTTTLTPGVVTEGFSMNFTPRVLPDNRVVLRYSIDLSSTDAIETFESPDGNSAIQLPVRSVRNFLQNTTAKSGETLVLTGFQQNLMQTSGAGPFSPKAWLFGGKKSADTLVRTIVIVVTPYVTEM